LSDQLDRRFHAYRDDIAAAELAGKLDGRRFVEGRLRQVRWSAAPLRRRPEVDAPLDTEALLGETVVVYEEAGGWSWCQLVEDHYVGYLPTGALGTEILPQTHRVSAVIAIVYAKPSALSEMVRHAALNAAVSVVSIDGRFAKLADGGYIGTQNLAGMDDHEPDYVATAMRFLGLPYRFGGKTAFGIDCSGLVQKALRAAGMRGPRDSDEQYRLIASGGKALGTRLDALRRGDIAFWSGHIGIMLDDTNLVHANATNMAVTVEPIGQVVSRTEGESATYLGAVRLPTVGSGGEQPLQFISPRPLPAST
jgi:cell wall-associated NlpC family hydrolase